MPIKCHPPRQAIAPIAKTVLRLHGDTAFARLDLPGQKLDHFRIVTHIKRLNRAGAPHTPHPNDPHLAAHWCILGTEGRIKHIRRALAVKDIRVGIGVLGAGQQFAHITIGHLIDITAHTIARATAIQISRRIEDRDR